MNRLPAPLRFTSDTGVRIYRVSCHAFPRLVAHAYLVLGAGPVTLVDTGSGYGDSTNELLAGLEALRAEFGETVGFADIQRIIITHGHIDHFGGLAQFAGPLTAAVGIHELDRWVLQSYEERVVVATKAIRFFLRRAGASPVKQGQLLELYRSTKQHMKSVGVDFSLKDGDEVDGMRFIHVPGHCPGQVCIRIGDVLLTADHVLPRTTPHQSPESITAWTGLGHYLESLGRVEHLEGIRVALGGHEEPFEDLAGRVRAIRADHQRKLEKIGSLFGGAPPLTIDEVAQQMYPTVTDWNVLLAVEEVGAHVEYLYERGALRVANLDEVEGEENPALRFARA